MACFDSSAAEFYVNVMLLPTCSAQTQCTCHNCRGWKLFRRILTLMSLSGSAVLLAGIVAGVIDCAVSADRFRLRRECTHRMIMPAMVMMVGTAVSVRMPRAVRTFGGRPRRQYSQTKNKQCEILHRSCLLPHTADYTTCRTRTSSGCGCSSFTRKKITRTIAMQTSTAPKVQTMVAPVGVSRGTER